MTDVMVRAPNLGAAGKQSCVPFPSLWCWGQIPHLGALVGAGGRTVLHAVAACTAEQGGCVWAGGQALLLPEASAAAAQVSICPRGCIGEWVVLGFPPPAPVLEGSAQG